ncbi:acetoin utilization AcuB family protein [Anaerobacillus sp. MEB173]|uniref:acetoin utilization AcuB family protein n=1 Tax=Anaerobacillus sp. MEB173 TaxID=3383345 RepID=UPI003F8F7C44
MIIEEIMNCNTVTISKDDTIETAINLLNQYRIRHLPIVDSENHVIGIISDRDIRDASPSIFHKEDHKEDLKKPVSTIMITDVITAHPLDFVEEVASMFYEHQIGCMPVTEENKLVGVVTETDILHTLVQLMGAHQPSSQIEVRVENITGKLAEIANIFKEKKINITSVLVYPSKDLNYKILVFRVQTMDPRGIIAEIEKEGYKVLWPNMPGVSE